KYLAEHVFRADASDDAIHSSGGAPEVLGDQLPFRRIGPQRRSQGVAGVLKRATMPFERDEGWLTRGQALFGQIRQGVKQLIDAGARFGRNSEFRRRG